MSELADTVLPLIRTRADLHRWSAANAHGRQMHHAVDVLEAAADDVGDAGDVRHVQEVYAVTQRAVTAATTVIMRADDSSGVIGDACRRLLDLHARLAPRAGPAPAKLVDWLVAFQFGSACDFFTVDPVAYAPALGDAGVAAYRARLEELGSDPDPAAGHLTSRCWALEWNARRLAVLDRDVDAIVRTHARDRKVAAWLEDTPGRWRRSARSISPSTGPGGPSSSTSVTSPVPPPASGASC